jgi:hypothetical protein
VRRGRSRDSDNPNPIGNFGLVFAHNFSQTPADTVSGNGVADCARGNKARAEDAPLAAKNTQHQKPAAMSAAISFDRFKL